MKSDTSQTDSTCKLTKPKRLYFGVSVVQPKTGEEAASNRCFPAGNAGPKAGLLPMKPFLLIPMDHAGS